MLQLDEEARGYFQHQLDCYGVFCGVDVLSYSILPNHLYLMVQVREEEMLSDDQLMHRLRAIYKPDRVDLERQLLKDAREANDEELANELRRKFTHRMWSISVFMKELQLHFTKWFNETHERCGKLWESLFRSTVVSDQNGEMRALAAYIELAAVREKLVKHPKDYPFTNFASAMEGNERARLGVQITLGAKHLSWKNLSNRFLHWLYLNCGKEAKGTSGASKRYAHRVKTEILEHRSERELAACYAEVQRGDTDNPLLMGALRLMGHALDAYLNGYLVVYQSRGMEEEVHRMSVLRLKLENYQLHYDAKELDGERFS